VGRHRPDPRGHARILIAAFAVVLALALLIVGAIALFGAMTSKPDAPGTTTSGTPGSPSRSPQSAAVSQAPPAGRHALVIKATGTVNVYVATPGNTKTLLNGTLNAGDIRTYDDKELVITVDPAQNVQVLINGKVVSKGQNGKQIYQVGS
jgi:hypothetical protein